MNLIVAVDRQWGIGYKGCLLAKVKEDLAAFKALTTGKTVIYGSNTLATFPRGEALKNRENIILNPSENFRVENAVVVNSLDMLFDVIGNKDSESLFVIGGASVYGQLLPYCSRAYVTKFEKTFPADVFIPNLDALSDWKCTDVGDERYSGTEIGEEFVFRFTVYERISNFRPFPDALKKINE